MEKSHENQKRGRGRPKGKAPITRTTILQMRLLDDEHAILAAKARARGMPLSTWARDTLLSAPR